MTTCDIPLGPRTGSKPAGSAENAAFRTPPALGVPCARAGHGVAPSRVAPVRLKAPKLAERPSRFRRLMRLIRKFMCFLHYVLARVADLRRSFARWPALSIASLRVAFSSGQQEHQNEAAEQDAAPPRLSVHHGDERRQRDKKQASGNRTAVASTP